jgi:hypothetical protein
VRKLAPIALVVLLAACGSRSVWEPANDNVARYGSWTDEELLLNSLHGAVFLILDQHPPSKNTAVWVRVPHDPEGYAAAALLSDGLERGGAHVSWISDDGVAPATSAQQAEVWEVATAIRGAVMLPADAEPRFRREATVEVRVSTTAPDGRLLWNTKAASKASHPVNLYVQVKKSVPHEWSLSEWSVHHDW